MSIIIVLLSLLFFFLYSLYKEIKHQKKAQTNYKFDKKLNKDILILLGGDQKAALRLLKNARKNNPGKSHKWCQEKIIRDLERDRRY